jgi:hypothetical protein
MFPKFTKQSLLQNLYTRRERKSMSFFFARRVQCTHNGGPDKNKLSYKQTSHKVPLQCFYIIVF